MTKTTNNMMNTITSKSVNPRVHGLGMHNKARRSFLNYLHATKVVIRRIDVSYNKQTNQYEENRYFTIVDDSPLLRDMGAMSPEIHKPNFLAFDVDGDGNSTKARRINIDGQKYVMSLNIMAVQCKDQKKMEELSDKGMVIDGDHYIPVTASPSNEKHAIKYFLRLTNEIPDEESAFWRLDKLMGGSLSDKLMKDPETGEPIFVSGVSLTKANTRIGNYASGMKLMGTYDLTKERVAVVKGSMLQASDFDPEIEEQMKEHGIKIDRNINDGAGYISASKLAAMFRDTLGLRMTEDDAMRIAIQTRWTGFTAKIMARALKTSTLEALAEFYNANIYGNPEGELVALIDEDGAKMLNYSALRDGSLVSNVYVMALANVSGVQSCGQHLIKYVAVDEQKTKEIISKLATLATDDFVVNRLESDSALTDMVNNRIMANLTPEEIYNDSFLMESVISDAWIYCRSMISEMKVALEGVYTHMMFDLTYALVKGAVESTLGITKEGFVEAYNPDVLRIYAAEIEAIENDPDLTEEQKDALLFEQLSGVVVKFPSAMPREFEIVVYQTKRQIANKIANLEITNEEKKALIEYFNTTPYGCTVYAPINSMKNKLAGADVDFDATMTDMSELKWILINKRLEEQETNPGFMGDCTFISYKDIVRRHLETNEDVIVSEFDDVDM